MIRTALRLAAGALLAGVLLWLFFRGVDGGAVRAALATARPTWLFGALLLTLAHFFVRAWRWRLLLTPLRAGLPLRPLLDAVVAGYAVTFLLPGRLGEVFRPLYLARRERLPVAGTLTTVGLDRLLDAAALTALLVVFLFLAPAAGPGSLPPEHAATLHRAGAWMAAGLVLAGPVLWWLAHRPHVPGATPGAGGSRRVRLVALWRSLAEGLAALRGPRLVGGALTLSAVVWVMLAAQAWCGLRAFGIELPFVAAFALIAFLAIGIAVPAPGGLGGFHATGRFCLVVMFGVPDAPAVAAILTLHLISVLPAILWGAWILARDGGPGRVLAAGARP